MTTLRDRVARSGRRLPRRSVRLRLTLVYASLFVASGAGLLAITYVLVQHDFLAPGPKQSPGQSLVPQPGTRAGSYTVHVDPGLIDHQHQEDLNQLLLDSGIALALMAAASIGLGWLAAGRVLRPLRLLNERARAISASSLHRRLGLTGPDDELSRLAGTFDDLLDRLEAAFAAQRRFVANASHELRTPLTLERALLEANLTDPDATIDSFRATSERLLALGQQQEQLTDALLTLASSERGLERHEPFDLAAVAGETLRSRAAELETLDLQLEASLDPAPGTGDPRLVERLVANLVDNAVRHNVPGGIVRIATGVHAGRAVLSVGNSGHRIPPAELDRILQPFQQGGESRAGHGNGHGLGLSIVNAIAAAHDATLSLRPPAEGGLEVEVGFRYEPAAASS
jgi:signal transduction histidine kinase